MKKLCWLATGGTIASRRGDDGLTPSFTAEELLMLNPQLNDFGSISCYDIMSLDSTNMNPSDWVYLAEYIEKIYDDYDGFVITHGTDTLEYTATALDVIFENLQKPVVLVASQRTIEEEYTDALDNLNAAFEMASQPTCGVYVVSGGQISKALWVQKLYSIDIKSLQSVNKDPVAVFRGEVVSFLEDLPEPDYEHDFIVHSQFIHKVAIIKLWPGMTTDILDFYQQAGYRGLVIEAFGAGGIPTNANSSYDIIGKLQELISQGMIVVCTTQCVHDGVQLDRYLVGKMAQDIGVIAGGKLSTTAVYTRLIFRLANQATAAELAAEFAELSEVD